MRGCAFEWRHPCHMILCYILCVCVCVWEREREISTLSRATLYDGMTFSIFTVIQNLIFFIYELFVICTHARMEKISSVFFTHFEWNVSIILSLPCPCRKIRCSVFSPYLPFDSRKPGWVRHYILPFYFSTIFIHRIPQSCSLRPLFEQRMNVFSHAPKRLYSLTLFFAPSSVFVHFCKSGLMIGHWNKLLCLNSRNVWIK